MKLFVGRAIIFWVSLIVEFIFFHQDSDELMLIVSLAITYMLSPVVKEWISDNKKPTKD